MLKRLPIPPWVALFIALAALLLAGPLWELPGLPGGAADTQIHLHRSAAVHRAFVQGVYWPRWFPDVYQGLGAPTFHYYSPGLYWLVAVAHWTGIRLDNAIKLVMTVALVLSGFGAYAWLRHAFGPAASLTGAALYLFHPRIWARAFYSSGPFGGAYPQLLALLLLPVCLWAFTSLYKQGRLRNWIAASVSLTALVYCHNLTAMIGAIILVPYCLLMAAGYRRADGLLRCVVVAALAAFLSAAFWLPALVDLSHVQGDNVREGYFHFSNHFLDLQQLFSFQSPILDSRDGNPIAPILTFGVASWLALAAGLVSLPFAVGGGRRVWGFLGILFALAMLTLTLQRSEPLWETIPGLSYIQFPYRFLGIAPLGALPAAAIAIDVWPARRRWLPGVVLVLAHVVVLFPYLFPASTLIIHPVHEVKRLSAEDTLAAEKESELWGMTTSNEFLVQAAEPGIATGLAPEPDATRLTWQTPHSASVDLSGQPLPALLRLHTHPGWSAGERAVLATGVAGWMQVSDVGSPSQPLVIGWEGTDAQRWGERLSFIGVLAYAGGLCYLAWKRHRLPRVKGSGDQHFDRLEPEFSPSAASLTLGAITGCLLILTVVRFGLARFGAGPFLLHSAAGQLDFSVEGPPITLGDDLTPKVTLLGWELKSSESPKPGGRVRVRLYWQSHGPIKEDLLSFLHLYVPAMQRSWAVENRGVPRPDSQWWDPTKYYIDDLILFVPYDLPPTTYSLVAGMVSASGERLSVPGSIDNLINLRALKVAPVRPGLLQRERPATKARARTDDSLRLQGFDLWPEDGSPTLRLFWETEDKVAVDWITYIHMHDSAGERIAQFDGPAIEGLQPTSQWHNNALYIDRRRLDLPEGIEAGEYQLRIGLYDRVSGERLPFQPDDNTQGNFENGQLLVPLTVEPSSKGAN